MANTSIDGSFSAIRCCGACKRTFVQRSASRAVRAGFRVFALAGTSKSVSPGTGVPGTVCHRYCSSCSTRPFHAPPGHRQVVSPRRGGPGTGFPQVLLFMPTPPVPGRPDQPVDTFDALRHEYVVDVAFPITDANDVRVFAVGL